MQYIQVASLQMSEKNGDTLVPSLIPAGRMSSKAQVSGPVLSEVSLQYFAIMLIARSF